MQLVLPLGQVENSSTCPTGQMEKKLLSYPGNDFFVISAKSVTLLSQPQSVSMIRNLAELSRGL